jgi:acetyl/propionyl-CoA carboxylase alpha subunit
MEHTLVAPIDGIVAEIAVAIDAQVAEGAKVMVIEAAKTTPQGLGQDLGQDLGLDS